MLIAQSVFGISGLLLLAWLFSENRTAIPYRQLGIALFIHVILAVILLKLPWAREVFLLLNQVVLAIANATNAGTQFIFGYLGGAPAPFDITQPQNQFILALQALPIILVMSALSALLYYFRILPVIVGGLSWLLQKSLRVSGVVGLGVAANAFVGMVEAPLLVKPYLRYCNRAEIFAIMVAGMATIAGTMMVLYANLLGAVLDNALGHILTASLLNLFACLIISQLLIPNTEPQTEQQITLPNTAYSAIDAIVRGTTDGVRLLVNIVALLLVLVALVKLGNQLLAALPIEPAITIEGVLGWLLAPFTFLLGIPLSELTTVGELMGIKIVLNEFLAYLALSDLPAEALSPRSQLIMLYALCGFANIGSLGIMLGGLIAMVPEKRDVIVGLGVKSVFAGVLTTALTAAVVGLILLF